MLLQGLTVNGQRATTGGTHEDTVIISTGERSCCRARGQSNMPWQRTHILRHNRVLDFASI